MKFLPLAFLFLTTASFAASNLVNADKAIPNLNTQLSALKQKTTLPVVFPQQLPLKANKTFYLSANTIPNTQGYIVSVDFTADCHGAHYCSAGTMLVKQTGQLPTIMKNRLGARLTKPVTLAKSITGYYTPGFAQGDYAAPTIAWQNNNMLYQINWQHLDKKESKAALIAMANSVIASK